MNILPRGCLPGLDGKKHVVKAIQYVKENPHATDADLLGWADKNKNPAKKDNNKQAQEIIEGEIDGNQIFVAKPKWFEPVQGESIKKQRSQAKQAEYKAMEYILVPSYTALVSILNQGIFLDPLLPETSRKPGGKSNKFRHMPHLHEIIVDKQTTPVWLGLDIEKMLFAEFDRDLLQSPAHLWEHGDIIIKSLLKYFVIFLKEVFAAKLPREDWDLVMGENCQVASSHLYPDKDVMNPQNNNVEGKVSFHVRMAIQMPSFEYTGLVVKVFAKWLKAKWRSDLKNEELSSLFGRKRVEKNDNAFQLEQVVLDTGIYGDFRLMRCLKSSKTYGDTRTLEPYGQSSDRPEDHLMMLHEQQRERDQEHMLIWRDICPDSDEVIKKHLKPGDLPGAPRMGKGVFKARTIVSQLTARDRKEMEADRELSPVGDLMSEEGLQAIRDYIETDEKIRAELGGQPVETREVLRNSLGRLIIPLKSAGRCVCPIKKGMHSSNNGYFVYDPKKYIGKYRCQDEDCKAKAIYEVEFRFDVFEPSDCMITSWWSEADDMVLEDWRPLAKGGLQHRCFQCTKSIVSMNTMRGSDLPFVDEYIKYSNPDMNIIDSKSGKTLIDVCNRDGVHVVEGGCGLGKSEAMRAFIASLDPSERILVISATRSVCCKTYTDLREFGFELYSETGSWKKSENSMYLDSDRLVICINSLRRVHLDDILGGFSTVIIDEALSVSQSMFQPSHMIDANVVCAMFDELMANTPRVILIDANMSNLMMCLQVARLRETRVCKVPTKVTWIRNTHVRKTNRKVDMIRVPNYDKEETDRAKSKVCSDIIQCMGKGERVCVAVTSPEIGEYIATRVAQAMPETRIGLYTSETDEETKFADFKDANRAFSRFDLLVYSPTMTAGVSFTLEHYDRLFAWLINSPGTPPAEVCLQMLFRVRQLKTGRMTLYISGPNEGAMCTYKDEEFREGDMEMHKLNPHWIAKRLDADIQTKLDACTVSRQAGLTSGLATLVEDRLNFTYKIDRNRLSWPLLIGQEYNRKLSRMCFGTLLKNELEVNYGIPVDDIVWTRGEGESSSVYREWKEKKKAKVMDMDKVTNEVVPGVRRKVEAMWYERLDAAGRLPYDSEAQNVVMSLDQMERVKAKFENLVVHSKESIEDKIRPAEFQAYYMSYTARNTWGMHEGNKVTKEIYEECIQLKGQKGKGKAEIEEKKRVMLRMLQALQLEKEDVLEGLSHQLEAQAVDKYYVSTKKDKETIIEDKNIELYRKNKIAHESKYQLSKAILEALLDNDTDKHNKIQEFGEVKLEMDEFREKFLAFIEKNGGDKVVYQLIDVFDLPKNTYSKDLLQDHRKSLQVVKTVLIHGLGINVYSKQKSDKKEFVRVISAKAIKLYSEIHNNAKYVDFDIAQEQDI